VSRGWFFHPTFHEDGALALQAILEQGFEGVMNLAGSEELTLRNVIERIGLALGEDPIISMKSGISTRLVGDNTCMRTLLGSTSLTPIRRRSDTNVTEVNLRFLTLLGTLPKVAAFI
jgi:hypothetical protein